MAIPNLIALLGLSGVIVSETKKYFGHLEIRDARLAAYKERRIGKRQKYNGERSRRSHSGGILY